jgi:hypothetical protein
VHPRRVLNTVLHSRSRGCYTVGLQGSLKLVGWTLISWTLKAQFNSVDYTNGEKDICTAKNLNFNDFNGILFDLKFPHPGTLGPKIY